jgi:hypothetical protein
MGSPETRAGITGATVFACAHPVPLLRIYAPIRRNKARKQLHNRLESLRLLFLNHFV